jgi:hypothetical protein
MTYINKPCPGQCNRLHICNRKLKNGMICGGRHPATSCTRR